MKKYKVIWYCGGVSGIEHIIKEMIVDAEDIRHVSWAEILPQEEKEKYEANLKYCVRVIHIIDGKKHSLDYGSWSKFIMIEELESGKQ